MKRWEWPNWLWEGSRIVWLGLTHRIGKICRRKFLSLRLREVKQNCIVMTFHHDSKQQKPHPDHVRECISARLRKQSKYLTWKRARRIAFKWSIMKFRFKVFVFTSSLIFWAFIQLQRANEQRWITSTRFAALQGKVSIFFFARCYFVAKSFCSLSHKSQRRRKKIKTFELEQKSLIRKWWCKNIAKQWD